MRGGSFGGGYGDRYKGRALSEPAPRPPAYCGVDRLRRSAAAALAFDAVVVDPVGGGGRVGSGGGGGGGGDAGWEESGLTAPRCKAEVVGDAEAQGPLRCSMARLAWETCLPVWGASPAAQLPQSQQSQQRGLVHSPVQLAADVLPLMDQTEAAMKKNTTTINTSNTTMSVTTPVSTTIIAAATHDEAELQPRPPVGKAAWRGGAKRGARGKQAHVLIAGGKGGHGKGAFGKGAFGKSSYATTAPKGGEGL